MTSNSIYVIDYKYWSDSTGNYSYFNHSYPTTYPMYAYTNKSVDVDKDMLKDIFSAKGVRLDSFPPCDVLLSKAMDKLIIRFAVAGYKKSEISVLSAQDNSLVLSLLNSKDKEDDYHEIHRGISKREVKHRKIQIDPLFDVSKSEISLKDGLLTVSIPRASKAAVKPLTIK